MPEFTDCNRKEKKKKKDMNQHFIVFIWWLWKDVARKIFPLLFDSVSFFVFQLTNNKALQQTALQTNSWHYDQTHIQPFKA